MRDTAKDRSTNDCAPDPIKKLHPRDDRRILDASVQAAPRSGIDGGGR
jgi:hypothetical protein